MIFHYQRLTSEEQVKALLYWHEENSTVVAIDTETTGLDPFNDTLTAIVVSGKQPHSAVLFDPQFVRHLNLLQTPTLLFHNFKFDFRMLRRAGVNFRRDGFRDTMLLHHLLDEEASHKLDDIVQHYFADSYKSEFWSKYKAFQEAPGAEQLEYACKDVIYTRLVYERLIKDLRTDSVPHELIRHVHRLAIALYDTEERGLSVDMDYLMSVGLELKPSIDRWRLEMTEAVSWACSGVELDQWAKEIEKLYNPSPRASAWKRVPRPEFNWDSHGQLAKLLYHKLKLPPRKNKAGNYSVDDAALEALQFQHPIIEKIREYRTYQKVYTAFIEGTLERTRHGRIHPSFNVNGTVTGRISSSDPNMQQLPSKGEWAKVRGIYRADPGHCIVTCDYSQLEVCIAAHFSLDPNLLKIVYEGASKHDITAEGVGIPRSIAKTLNFAMQYQCSPHKVRQIVGCSASEAELIWNKYWETYAGERKVIDECKAKVDRGEPIVNLFGRKRRFPGNYEAKWQKESAYRRAYSSLIQGTGSDCTHEAFYTVSESMLENAWGYALFEVHDEIVNMPTESYCGIASEMLQSVMVNVGKRVGLRVPLSVDCSAPLQRWEK